MVPMVSGQHGVGIRPPEALSSVLEGPEEKGRSRFGRVKENTMSFARKVESQRAANQAAEERRKAHEVKASTSGKLKAVEVKPEIGPSLLSKEWDAMTAHKSQKTLRIERKVAERKAAGEAAKAEAQGSSEKK